MSDFSSSVKMVNFESEFSLKEENEILQYIIRNNKYENLCEEQFWKEVENLGIAKGTWHNLKCHFENSIIHKLKHPQFKLTDEEIDNILRASSYIQENYDTFYDDEKNGQAESTTVPLQVSTGQKIIVISRRKNSNIYPNYRAEGRKRILISRHNNPVPDMTYFQSNPDKPKKTIVATLCPGKRKEIFVVRSKEEEPFESNSSASSSKETDKKPPKRLICFSYNVS